MSSQPRQIKQYELLECVARGGMGEIWKAFDTQLMRLVAIKLLRANFCNSPDFISRFKSEAQVIASLHHPNIIKIHNFDVTEAEDGKPLFYMVMDYIQGQNLAGYIRSTSRVGLFPSPAAIVSLFSSVGLALDCAHEHGMIHRDIKPANILLDQSIAGPYSLGIPILTDFGIARRQGVSLGTIIGSILGTPLYMAPEQVLGQYDEKRSDLYSLGIILYEIMTGTTPFSGNSAMAIVVQHIHGSPPAPETINSRISPRLSQVILKSIAKEPPQRFQSACEMALALAQSFGIHAPEELIQHCGPSYLSPDFLISYIHKDQPVNSSPDVSASTSESISDAEESPLRFVDPGISHMPTHALTFPPLKEDNSSVSSALVKPLQKPKKKNYGRLLLLMSLVVLIISFSLGAFLLINRPGADQVVGRVHFLRTSTTSNYNAIQIELHRVPNPAPGSHYYAWIDSSSNEHDKPHWPLTVNQGSILTSTLTYANASDLLQPGRSLFLITSEKDEGEPPIVPDIDPQARLYYAVLTPGSRSSFDIRSCPPAADNTNVCNT